MTSELEEQVRDKGGNFLFFQFDNWPTQKPLSQPDSIQIDTTGELIFLRAKKIRAQPNPNSGFVSLAQRAGLKLSTLFLA